MDKDKTHTHGLYMEQVQILEMVHKLQVKITKVQHQQTSLKQYM